MTVEYLDRPAPGWFVLDVMKASWREWNWVALMIDVDPDDRKQRGYYVPARERWLRIPGKHKNRDAACDALFDMMATRQ